MCASQDGVGLKAMEADIMYLAMALMCLYGHVVLCHGRVFGMFLFSVRMAYGERGEPANIRDRVIYLIY